jgi:toxin-antitoxin system PIN domain toxin
VKLPDVNLLLYAVDEGAVRHEPARAWVEERLSGSETFAFIRLTTSPRVFQSPLSTSEALDLVDSWLAQPCVTLVHPTSRHAPVLRDLLEPLGTAGNLTTDAHLAALAIEHGAELCSTDRDFSRFAGLRWANPLEA